MGLFSRVSTVTSSGRRAGAWPLADNFYASMGTRATSPWELQLAGNGVHVSPHLAMTLSAIYCGVTMIAQDIGTMPAHMFKRRDDGGKTRERRRGLEALLRWQPNPFQTATEYWSTNVGHILLRGWSLSEIVTDKLTGEMAALLPRNPDRCEMERLPSGRLRYKLREPGAPARYLTSEEVFVVRDFCTDPLTPVSRIAYGMRSMGMALTAEKYAAHAFKTGASASMIATHKEEMDEEEEATLHASITRYMSGAENAGGILVIGEDVSIEKLGIEPEKLQMMAARQFGVSEIARWLKIPGHKLEAATLTQAYAAREAANLEYLIGCLRPIVISIEQAIQRDIILPEERDEYFVEFLMDALFRGDMKTRADYYERAIRSRWMRPSEVRALENMNPDPALDALSERDFQPGASGTAAAERGRGGRGRREDDPEDDARASSWRQRSQVRATLLVFEAAQRVVRKEVAAVTRLATKHASDVDAWKAELAKFYGDHAGFVAEALRLPTATARAYATQHQQLLEQHGVPVMADWERLEAEGLASVALDLESAA